MKVSFLIPAFNEARTVAEVIERVRALPLEHLRQNDFAIEPEITAKVCKQHLRIYEIPISYYGRPYAEGKKITWLDCVKAFWVLLRIRFTA
jgi:hypothetical protein